MVDENRRYQVDEYRQVLKIENAKKFKEEREENGFIKRLKQEIGPVYRIAVNQSLGFLRIFFRILIHNEMRNNYG